MVKQALFNKLGQSVVGARFLDLFCGSGAIGIEALSRGAEEVIFADADARSVALTKRNLEKIGTHAKVIKCSYEKTLASLSGQFDIIFLDPPYKSEFYLPALEIIAERDLLAAGGVIVCEHDKTYSLPTHTFRVADEKIYGIKKLTYLEK